MKRSRGNFIAKAIAACFYCVVNREALAFAPGMRNIFANLRTKESTELNYVQEFLKGFVEAPAEYKLKKYQERGRAIASSFSERKYEAHPLFMNRHFQTIFGVFVRDSPGCAYIERSNIFAEGFPVLKAVAGSIPKILGLTEGETRSDYWDERERFATPDSDFFDVDYKFVNPATKSGGKGTVVIVHGLESNSNSTMCTNMAKAFIEKSMDVACINFRGCSGVPNDTIFQYHSGFTDDLVLFFDKWSERGNNKPLYVTGFSLGSNVVMKALGDLGMQAVEKYNIRGAAVSGAPFDLNYHWRQLIDDDFNRIVYAGNLLRSMKKKANNIVDTYFDGDTDTDVFDYWGTINAKTIPEVEDSMVAPVYGFKDKFDYYDQSASLPVVDSIAVPTYILNAVDDPFFDPDFYPIEKDCEGKSDGAPVKFVRTKHGGHLGHMFHVVDEDFCNTNSCIASFAPMELARFLEHVHANVFDL
mmetsp:Transcript_27580/g.63234  ORF Transcript_27580/g.63234 Transcript_27580/m.63234 type:complete len:472 (-) Transcript_27580:296-1711(-)